eukprot:356111-Chlamydomonas_euryale.AAC.2
MRARGGPLRVPTVADARERRGMVRFEAGLGGRRGAVAVQQTLASAPGVVVACWRLTALTQAGASQAFGGTGPP